MAAGWFSKTAAYRNVGAGRIVTLLLVFLLSANLHSFDSNRGSTYSSPAFRFSYTYPIRLIGNTADFRRKLGPHFKGQRTTFVLLSAYEAPSPTRTREGIVIMADDVSYYRGLRDGRDYLHRATVALERQGWIVLRQEVPVTIDGHQFFRNDYVFRRKTPPIFQSSVCTIWKGYALDFVLSGGSTSDVDQLFRSLSTIHFEKTPST